MILCSQLTKHEARQTRTLHTGRGLKTQRWQLVWPYAAAPYQIDVLSCPRVEGTCHQMSQPAS